MFNLIRRDIILQKKMLLTFIPFIGFFIFMDSHPALIFLVASIFIPFNAYAYDEKAETNILLNSLPYTRKEIIASRYLGAVMYMLLAIGVTSLALFIFNKPFALSDIAIGGGLFLLFTACTFPLFYLFKPGHITTVILVSFILLAGIGPSVVMFLAEHLTAITDFIVNLSVPALYTGAAIVIITLYAISWGATTFIYQRKAL
ncbi:ABC-2 transporter permease [Halalkalibacterium halodurans]|uniref:BH0653 protein n=2 Tax=Halalkalibacterium halodurans TaxID=86665 RepID=Q7AJY1_HALH5|nr:ABC-2 transporter permease [Halalkalibacterium halodurans]MDY7221147.1 ABC-2 transporter permease [Halalkalibacterium halodurans]MDY7240386.1 ABC-2 transporter permease [Halalkalibacterium halodurans]MED4082718.1 ABC-2 transporter permease [Halalkalibacterium halodurans]MED4086644.1 ABC-2 transporter permease [Halalkalibacterium halodurans]MED4103220.1 ABC-2 transporter permease [Halalkalibacterium halodurans]